MNTQLAFVSLFAATVTLSATACAIDPGASADSDVAEGTFVDESDVVTNDGKADALPQFSERCRKRAVSAAGILEKQNKATTKVKKVTLVEGAAQADQRLRVEVDRTLNGKKTKDAWLVDLYEREDTCQLMAINSEKKSPIELDPEDYEMGSQSVQPGVPCSYAAKKAVNGIVADNDYELPQYALKVDGFTSKTANVLRVLVAEDIAEEWGGMFVRPWAVKTEPFGKSGCFVWGMRDGFDVPVVDDAANTKAGDGVDDDQ